VSSPRLSTSQRGYGAAHEAIRRQLEPLVAAGMLECARCGKSIKGDEPWDLGHDDVDRSSYTGPEHRRCNRQTATHRMRRVSRVW
jgi:hypothetical protein